MNNPHLCEIWSVFTVSRTLKVVTFYFLIPHINGFPPGQLTAYHSRQILANRVVFIVSEFARLRQIFSPLLRFPGQLSWPVQRSRTMSDSVLIVSRQAFFMEFFKSCKIKISRYASHGHWAKKKNMLLAQSLCWCCRLLVEMVSFVLLFPQRKKIIKPNQQLTTTYLLLIPELIDKSGVDLGEKPAGAPRPHG